MKLEAFKEFQVDSKEVVKNQGGGMWEVCIAHGETVCNNQAGESDNPTSTYNECTDNVWDYCSRYETMK